MTLCLNPIKTVFLFLSVFLSCSTAIAAEKGDIHVVVEGLRNDTGNVRISLFSSKDGFPARQEKAVDVTDLTIHDGTAKGNFTGIAYGVYAVAAIHDENENGKLDFKWKVVPAEGYGASNNPESFIGPPPFRKARFTLEQKELQIVIKMQYW